MNRLASLLLPALILAVDMIGPAPAAAQVRVATLDDLRRELSPGDVVSVAQTTGDVVRGRLIRFGDTELEIRAEPRRGPGQERRRLDVTIPRNAVRSLERPRDPSRNGALIGAGIGAGTTLAMFVYAAAVDYNEAEEWAPAFLALGGIYTGVGALVGWAVDRAHSKPHVRFDASPTARIEIRVAPSFSRGRGVAVIVKF